MKELHRVTPSNRHRTESAPIVRHFASLAEIIADADEINDRYGNKYPDAAVWTYGAGWTDEAATRAGLLAGEAPPEALAEYETIRAKYAADTLSATPATTRRRLQVWADQGDEIDPDRMNARHDRPWRATVIGRTAPIVRLALNVGISGSNAASEFSKLGATAAAIADALSAAGYSVEFVGCVACVNDRDNRGPTVYTFPLKASHEPLDIRRLLSASAPGLLRAYLFPRLEIDNANPAVGVAHMPRNAAALIGTPHIIARHWENGTEVTPAQQAARIIAASQAHAAA